MNGEIEFGNGVGWVLLGDGGNKYIGKAVTILDNWKDMLRKDIGSGCLVELNPGFDYLVQIVQNQQGQIGKQPLLVPFDITSGPVAIWVKASMVVFLDELQEEDRAGYKKLTEAALAMLQRARLARSGIVMPSSNVRPLR